MRSFFICFLAFAILAVTKAQMGGQPVHTLPTDDDAQSAAAVAANSMCEAGSRCYVVSVLDVQRQIVAGTNFYLVFIYSQFSANSMRSLLTARAKVYKDLMGEQQVLESEKAMSSEAPTSVHGQLQTAVEQHFAGSSNADISFSSTIDSVLAETIENDDYSTTPSHKNTFTVYVFDGYLMCAAACSEVPPAVTSRKNTFVVYTVRTC